MRSFRTKFNRKSTESRSAETNDNVESKRPYFMTALSNLTTRSTKPRLEPNVEPVPEAGKEPPVPDVKEEFQEELPVPEAGKEPPVPEVKEELEEEAGKELPAPEVKQPVPEVKEEPRATQGNQELTTEQSNQSQLPEPKPPANNIVEAQPETCGIRESTVEPLPGLQESNPDRRTFTEIYVAVRGSVVYVIGRVGDSIILIKSKALEMADIAQVKLMNTFTPVKPQVVRLKNGVLLLQGQVLSVQIQIKAAAVQTFRKTADVTFSCCQSVGDVLQRIAGPSSTKAGLAYNSIATATSAGVSRCYITVRDGYFYVGTYIGGRASYLKTSMYELCLNLKAGSLTTFSALSRVIGVSVISALRVAAIPFVFAKEKFHVLYCNVTKGTLHMKAKFGDFLVLVKIQVLTLCDAPVLATAVNALQNTKTRAVEAGAGIRDAVNPKVQVTAASAATGAVALGIGAGSAGLVAGGAVGAAIGVVPALFTFGLSIPIGAMMGGGAGLCVGTAAGGTAGFISGGAVGYGVFSHRQGIEQLVTNTVSQANQCKEYMIGRTSASQQYLRTHLIGGIGGTALA